MCRVVLFYVPWCDVLYMCRAVLPVVFCPRVVLCCVVLCFVLFCFVLFCRVMSCRVVLPL